MPSAKGCSLSPLYSYKFQLFGKNQKNVSTLNEYYYLFVLMNQELPDKNNCCTDNYSVCIDCGAFDECGCKDNIKKGRINGLAIYLLIVFVFSLLYFLIF